MAAVGFNTIYQRTKEGSYPPIYQVIRRQTSVCAMELEKKIVNSSQPFLAVVRGKH